MINWLQFKNRWYEKIKFSRRVQIQSLKGWIISPVSDYIDDLDDNVPERELLNKFADDKKKTIESKSEVNPFLSCA